MASHPRFCHERLATAFGLLDRAVADGLIPGAVALVGCGDVWIGPHATGWAATLPQRRPMTGSTLFDMASVTKVVVATTAALQLLESGVWRLDDPVHRFWPQFTLPVTLRHLLTHTSGLAAWQPIYADGHGPEAYRRALQSLRLTHEPGERVIYSCLGFLVLTELIERITGQPLNRYADERIFGPLGMEESTFRPKDPGRCAATEVDPKSGEPLLGIVHDENARFRGGVSGNAGMFATAHDLGLFCRAMLQGGQLEGVQLLAPRTVAVATSDHTPHLTESRGLGWAVHAGRSQSADLFSRVAFGHTGFTGTSVWLDPTTHLFVVLLTNRVHPTRENESIHRLRAVFHNAVAGAVVY